MPILYNARDSSTPRAGTIWVAVLMSSDKQNPNTHWFVVAVVIASFFLCLPPRLRSVSAFSLVENSVNEYNGSRKE